MAFVADRTSSIEPDSILLMPVIGLWYLQTRDFCARTNFPTTWFRWWSVSVLLVQDRIWNKLGGILARPVWSSLPSFLDWVCGISSTKTIHGTPYDWWMGWVEMYGVWCYNGGMVLKGMNGRRRYVIIDEDLRREKTRMDPLNAYRSVLQSLPPSGWFLLPSIPPWCSTSLFSSTSHRAHLMLHIMHYTAAGAYILTQVSWA